MEDRCIMCGEYVPEGRQVCKVCENQILNNNKQISKSKKRGIFVNLTGTTGQVIRDQVLV